MKRPALLLTCEHGGNRVPARYRPLFATARARALLESHRGLDIGALSVARHLARRFQVPLLAAEVTRLLVDLNRSSHHPALLSPLSRGLSAEDREELLQRHYHPHRDSVETAIRLQSRRAAPVVHVAVHSFTPRLRGETRRADIGLLYDPARRRERSFCHAWRDALRRLQPGLRVRRNYPYRGSADGLTPHLRKRFPPALYLGLELELNQALLTGTGPDRRAVVNACAESLAQVLSHGAILMESP